MEQTIQSEQLGYLLSILKLGETFEVELKSKEENPNPIQFPYYFVDPDGKITYPSFLFPKKRVDEFFLNKPNSSPKPILVPGVSEIIMEALEGLLGMLAL